MKTAVDRKSARSTTLTDLATLARLLNTLVRFALVMSLAMLAIDLASTPDMPSPDEFMYAIGSAGILPLTFFLVSTYISLIYIGAVRFEPEMLAVWEQASRIPIILWTLLPRILWALVCLVGPLGAALLIGASHPYRDPDEATGSRRVATSDASPRFTHRWVAGTSPQILHH